MARMRVPMLAALVIGVASAMAQEASAPASLYTPAVAGEPAPKVMATAESAADKHYEQIVVQRWAEAATPSHEEQPPPRSFEPRSPEFWRMINDIERWRFNASAVEIGAVPAVASATVFELIPDLSPDDVARVGASKYGKGNSYNYGEVLGLSWKFYEAQRSGKLPSSNRITWRGDSALNDKTPNGQDLTGGLYDAGDHLKLHFPLAFSAGILAQSVIESQPGYSSSGQNAAAMDTIRWIADYFMKAHHEDRKFTGQVGDPGQDHAFWGRPEDMTMDRPSYDITPDKPGSDLIGQVVGALAAAAMVFKQSDPSYSARLEQHARSLYELMKYEGKYSNSIDKAYVYPSSNVLDDMAWGSAWMYRLTKDQKYLDDAKKYRARNKAEEDGGGYLLYNWDSAPWGVDMVMATLVPEDPFYSTSVKRFLEAWMKGEGPIRYTPKGLAWGMEWGSLRHTSNAAHIALLYAKAIKNSDPQNAARYACWARGQINYMLGDAGRSFVVGHGNNPPERPHHRGSSCPTAVKLGVNNPVCDYSWFDKQSPNPQTLAGALVGGPGSDDSYDDRRQDYQKNEVAVDYNAGFTGALASLASSDMNWMVCNQLGLEHAGPAPLSVMEGVTIDWNPVQPGAQAPAQEVPMPTRPSTGEAAVDVPAAPAPAPSSDAPLASSPTTVVQFDAPAPAPSSEEPVAHSEAPTPAPVSDAPVDAPAPVAASEAPAPMPTQPPMFANAETQVTQETVAPAPSAYETPAYAPAEAPSAGETPAYAPTEAAPSVVVAQASSPAASPSSEVAMPTQGPASEATQVDAPAPAPSVEPVMDNAAPAATLSEAAAAAPATGASPEVSKEIPMPTRPPQQAAETHAEAPMAETHMDAPVEPVVTKATDGGYDAPSAVEAPAVATDSSAASAPKAGRASYMMGQGESS